MKISLLIALFFLMATPPVFGASWAGYVLNNESVAINAANVTAISNPGGTFINSTLTNATGFFNISIPDSTSVNLTSSKSTFQNDTSQALPPITTDRLLPFNITLIRNLPGNLTGKITDHVGNDLENATVEAIQANVIKGSAVTNSSGDYIIADLRDGTYTVTIRADGITQNYTNVVILPGKTTQINVPVALDLNAPIISNIYVSSITSSGAIITWTTNEAANSTFYYGTDTATTSSSTSAILTTSHSISLSGLSSNTLYYFNASSCDAFENCNTSAQFTFTTLESTTSGVVSGGAGGGGGGCTFNWACTDWQPRICPVAQMQTRICTNQGTCFDDYGKPDETRSCIPAPLLPGPIAVPEPTSPAIPEQLFDIKMELDESVVASIDNLVARVTFESFGRVPTPVILTFTILNKDGIEVVREEDSITVETEIFVTKTFEGLELEPGRYTLVLRTLYSIDVEDEFRQEFEIKRTPLLEITGRVAEVLSGAEPVISNKLLLFFAGIIALIFVDKVFLRKKKKSA